MARRSRGDIGSLITIVGFLYLAPIFIIIWIVKAVNKNKGKRVAYTAHVTSEKISNRGQNMNIFNENKAITDAKVKLEEISEEKKLAYSLKRKKYFKKRYITLASLCFFFGLLFLFAFIGSSREVGYIAWFSILIITGIVLTICLIIQVKKPMPVLALDQIEYELKKLYKMLTTEKYSSMYNTVIKESNLYKNIVSLNNDYDFDYINCGKRSYTFIAKSKQGVENYDFDKSLLNIINDESSFYNSIQKIYEDNEILYKQYESEYLNIKKFLNRNEVENLKINIEYEFYNYIEKDLYQLKKLKPITRPSVEIVVEYTSPTGRNYYKNNHTYTYTELIEQMHYYNSRKELLVLEQARKIKTLEEKRQKEKKLRDLDKLEKQLKEKEQLINEKEAEFKKATKGHIYSSEVDIAQENMTDENEETQYQKLKKLKKQFENGEITREEYNKKRNELL